MIGLSLGMQFGKGSGGGQPPAIPVFITTWKTDNAGVSGATQVKLPLVNGGTYNFVVDWGDGNSDTITAWDQAESTHTYAIAGTYEIRITGTIVRWQFNNGGDKLKILNISAWGPLAFVADAGVFFGCSNLTCSAIDAPDLSACTSLSGFFRNCTAFNGAIGNWDVSNVTIMNVMFFNCQTFNQDLSAWDVSNVTTIANMFQAATVFNGNVSSWNTSSLLNMNSTFFGASQFNQDITGWDTSSVTDMQSMFRSADSFNQNIGGWNTSLVTTMNSMFLDNDTFNQNLGSWDITSLINAAGMFANALAFSTANYDALLIGWEAQVEKPNVTFSAGTTKYSAGAAATARAALVANGWVITDGGQV